MAQKKAFSHLRIDRLAKFKHQLLQIEKQTRFFSTSPMFVPSLSWYNDQFYLV